GGESTGLNLIIDLLILFAAVLYCSLIYWTYADARRRIADPIMIGFATVVAIAFPFLGPIIYLILRPPEYLEDVRERELDMQAAEARVRELEQARCPHCEHPIERDFVRCPGCRRPGRVAAPAAGARTGRTLARGRAPRQRSATWARASSERSSWSSPTRSRAG